jgi:NADH-quinone oxidoreductase subunit G
VGSLDSVGANIWLNGRLGEVARIVPRDNADVENGLIDDVTRFSWECIDDPDRLRKGQVDGDKINFAGACKAAAHRIKALSGEHGPDSVGIIAGSNLNTEEYLALRKLALDVFDTRYFHFGEELLGAMPPDSALLSAMTSHVGSISEILNASTVLTIGTDLFEEAPALGLWLDVNARRHKLQLINLRSHGSGADSGATYVAYPPGDLLRWVRALTNAISGGGEVLPELIHVAAQLGNVGDDCAILFGNAIWTHQHPAELLEACEALRNAISSENGNKPVWLNPVYAGANSAGALLVQHLHQFGSSPPGSKRDSAGTLRAVLEAAAESKVRSLLIVDSDVLNTYPDRYLVETALSKAEVIYCGPFAVPTARQAGVVIPLGTWAHREGTVVSLEWRVQKRMPGQVDSVSPDVLDLCNILSSECGQGFVGSSIAEMYLQLGELIAGWPLAGFDDFPGSGQRFVPVLNSPSTEVKRETSLPAETTQPENTLRLIPKRFLYNDRQEILHSPVFRQVAMPFHAFINPADAERFGLASGDWVSLTTAGAWPRPAGGENRPTGNLELQVKLVSWVEAGSVVVNDLNHKQPANRLHASAAVSLKAIAVPTESQVGPASVQLSAAGGGT